MFQDSAGTTPVTAVEQPVGLILDKSKGLAVGAELVTNGNNEAALYTNSSTVNGTIARAAAPGGGFAAMFTCNAGTFSYQALWSTVPANTPVRISVRVYVPTGSITGIQVFDANDGSWFTATSSIKDSWITFTAIRPAKATAWIVGIGQIAGQTLGGQVFYLDDLSVRSLAGNHASQATSTSRPVLSARVNLLTYSEQFDNAAWAPTGATISANTNVAPSGAATADTLVEDTSTGVHRVYQTPSCLPNTTYTYSVFIKAAGRSQVRILETVLGGAYFDLSAETITATDAGVTASIQAVGSGWYRCRITATTGGSQPFFVTQIQSGLASNTTYTGTGIASLYIWGADLRVTNDGVGIPAYQRVAAATDYDTSGFPLYLAFDGVDDSLATASVDFSATNKMSVFAGLRKLSDAAVGSVVELSANVNTNSGSFWVAAPVTVTGPNYYFVSRGTTAPSGSIASGRAAPTTNVITGLGDIVAPQADIRVNASQIVTDATTQGTGNFGNYPLYIGSRGGVSAWLNGRIYSLIVRGAASNADQIARTETWVNNITKAY
jgi:hypothetical protein